MFILIGKVKSGYRNILSQENEILDQLDTEIIDTLEFSPSHKLEDDEWFYITDFSKGDFFIDLCKEDFSAASLSQIGNPSVA